MKKLYFILLLAVFIKSSPIFAQLNNGGQHAFFGIDGDTRSNYIKYGPSTGLISSDDWFSFSPAIKNVIDTANASYYRTLLQAGENLGFSQRMSAPLYSKFSGKLWLDAAYGRDWLCTNPLTDSTAFTIACKNGDNPANWVGGATNFPDKNDLIDVFAHMRRDGITVYDSLWLFTGTSTVGVVGSRYFDIELYKKTLNYTGMNPGVFSTSGTDAGHTQWIFDASGNITQTGDMILAVSYNPGSAPIVDVRIWLSSTTFATVIPNYFKFGPVIDGSTPAFGYVSILSNSGATNFGSGIANISATPANDTTFSTPWGTEKSDKSISAYYDQLQLIEIGLNLTRMGVDPSLYSNLLSPCESLFASIFFKSRSSNSFSSNMQDFVKPLEFLRNPVMDYSLVPDTLNCNTSVGNIVITNNSTIGHYTWSTPNGTIIGSSTDSSQINVSTAGTYIVSASPAEGCPSTRTDTIRIPLDTFPPVSSIVTGISMDLSTILLYGGDPAASNYPTPFGGSQGLLWNWSGPNAFSSTNQNPTNDTAWGTYQLVVTEMRNGCKDTISATLNRLNFVILAPGIVKLSGVTNNQSILLKWDNKNETLVNYYIVEKSFDGVNFITLGNIAASNSSGFYYYSDNQPGNGNNLYRIRSVNKSGSISYSNIIKILKNTNGRPQFTVINNYSKGDLSLLSNSDNDYAGTVLIYSLNGQLIQKMPVRISKGASVIDVPLKTNLNNEMIVVALQVNNEIVFKKKILR